MPLTPREREQIADQILTIIEELFVHRRMKTALYGVDPIALFHSLRGRAAQMPDGAFHRALRIIVSQLRDRHTRYSYAGAGPRYELPLTIEKAFDGDAPVYLVTDSQTGKIPIGSEVLQWNGVPPEFIIRELAEDIGAGNDATRRALALMFLTKRPPARLDPPIETEVRLDLRLPDGAITEATLRWSRAASAEAAVSPAGALTGLGVDVDLLTIKHRMFELSPRFAEVSAQPFNNVQTSIIKHDGVEFGQLRIIDFDVDDADSFAEHVATRVSSLPKNGLIIDLRGNPGGYIKAGELLLQLFTDQTIRPNGFRFRASDAVDYMLGMSNRYTAWMPTVAQGTRLGAEHSAIFPIEGDEGDFNKIGRVYSGPSVLIVDALTFSTADMFTAGYQDHGIGPVICTDENVSAGGANNWPYALLRTCFPGFLVPAAVESDLNNGVIGAELRRLFEANGQPLPNSAAVGPSQPDKFGSYWEISTGATTYRVTKRDWLRNDLAIHFDGDNRFVRDLPQGVEFGFSIRQAVRQRRSDGLVLEDEGITADHFYRLSRTDILASNADLNAFACNLLLK